MIRLAHIEDCANVPVIQMSAGNAFRAIGMDAVAENPVPPPDFFHETAQRGTLWVATDAHDTAIGFANCWGENGFLYVDELSVHATHQKQGLGRALMGTLIAAARDRNLQGLVLRTFCDVTWNGPFYASLGFVEERPPELEALLSRCRRAEEEIGLDMARRCTMALRF